MASFVTQTCTVLREKKLYKHILGQFSHNVIIAGDVRKAKQINVLMGKFLKVEPRPVIDFCPCKNINI